jgi:dienelactone hydrolase
MVQEEHMKLDRYGSHLSLRQRWDAVGRKMALRATTRKQLARWRAELSAQLKRLIGYDTLEQVPLRARVTEERTLDGYRRQRVELRTEQDVVMPLFVLIPTAGTPPFPAVIACHGHGLGGKVAIVGCRDNPEIAAKIDQHNSDYGLSLVRAGFVVFCPDARGFGERREIADRRDPRATSCRLINNMAIPLGRTVTGLWTWDIHRLVDYIETRTDCVPGRIGCAGLSGGGHQTLWAAALDERIRCAVVSGYFYGYKESLLDLYTNCSCNYVPHLWEYADMGDIGALIAPRPLLIETGTRDGLNGARGVANARSQVAIARRAYRLLCAERNLKHDVFEGEHAWRGVQAIPWMQRHLGAA